jgi:3',5'-cyclic AMP phosphodiesterase CpdA
MKIVVTHHPFDLPADWESNQIVRRAPMAMQMFAHCGADILLAGHIHMSHAGDTTARYSIQDFSALVVQAGTATSTRARGELNSFNVLRIALNAVVIERYTWDGSAGDFILSNTETFERKNKSWIARAA